jgi:predicted nuclease with TOPRIM domain
MNNYMDLHELATNARLNHWLPHLGVTTEAEKIEYLAQQLEAAGDVAAENEDLIEQNTAAQEEIAEHERTIEALRAEIYDLNETIKELKAKVAK